MRDRERNMVRHRVTPLDMNVKMMLDGNFILFLNIFAWSHLQKTPFIICEHNFSIKNVNHIAELIKSRKVYYHYNSK